MDDDEPESGLSCVDSPDPRTTVQVALLFLKLQAWLSSIHLSLGKIGPYRDRIHSLSRGTDETASLLKALPKRVSDAERSRPCGYTRTSQDCGTSRVSHTETLDTLVELT